MNDTPFLAAFNEGRTARRNGLLKRSNPYFNDPNHHHLKRTWEGGWECEAQAEGCAVSAEIKSDRFDLHFTVELTLVLAAAAAFVLIVFLAGSSRIAVIQ